MKEKRTINQCTVNNFKISKLQITLQMFEEVHVCQNFVFLLTGTDYKLTYAVKQLGQFCIML